MLPTLGPGRHLPLDRVTGFVRGHRAVHAERPTRHEPLPAEAGADPFATATQTFGGAPEPAVLDRFARVLTGIGGGDPGLAADPPDPVARVRETVR